MTQAYDIEAKAIAERAKSQAERFRTAGREAARVCGADEYDHGRDRIMGTLDLKKKPDVNQTHETSHDKKIVE